MALNKHMLDQGDPLGFSVELPKRVYQQIREHVRGLIVRGELPPGAKLPSTKELASKWSVPPATVQMALTHLVKEGLLTRIRKKGTFVLDRNPRLERIGAYYDSSIWSSDAGSFKQMVHMELLKLCGAKGIKLEAFFDERKAAQRTTPQPEITQAIETRTIQALIATDIAANEAAWIDKLPIPSAVFLEAEHTAKVDLDFAQFLELGIKKLKASGCRSVGLISLRGPWKPAVGAIKTNKATHPIFEGDFAKLCDRFELTTGAQWIKTADEFVQGRAQQKFGYEQFRKIWDLPTHPDGLIAYPNTCASGAITAVLERRVDVPGQLKLVLHKHRELDYLCPLKVDFLYTCVAEVAQALLQQVIDQFKGKDRPNIIIPFTVDP